MSKQSPVYRDNRIAEWVDRIAFEQSQISIITSVCDDAAFLYELRNIAETYATVKKLHAKLTTDRENIATMADLGDSVASLLVKLNGLPARVDAHLYKFSDEMPNLKRLLSILNIQISAAKTSLPKPSTNRPSTGPERSAAQSLVHLFDRHGLECVESAPIPGTSKVWAAGECMKIIFTGRRPILGDHAISDYIKSARKSMAKNSQTKP